MSLGKLLIIGLGGTLILWVALFFLISTAITEVDENGGLKALTERVWEGKNE